MTRAVDVAEKLLLAVALTALLTGSASSAQSQPAPASPPAFEVASIKPADTAVDALVRSVDFPPGDNSVTIGGMSLTNLIQIAYGDGLKGLHPDLVSGGPAWSREDRYDIVAKAAGPDIRSLDDRKEMLKALLAKRFDLKFHRESRAIRVWVLVVRTGGPKMNKRRPGDGGTASGIQSAETSMTGRNASMAELAYALQGVIPKSDPERGTRVVLDKTGLPGRFDFDLIWTPEDMVYWGKRSLQEVRPKAPDLFASIKGQLGVQVKSEKAAVEVIVIDHAEKPSAN